MCKTAVTTKVKRAISWLRQLGHSTFEQFLWLMRKMAAINEIADNANDELAKGAGAVLSSGTFLLSSAVAIFAFLFSNHYLHELDAVRLTAKLETQLKHPIREIISDCRKASSLEDDCVTAKFHLENLGTITPFSAKLATGLGILGIILVGLSASGFLMRICKKPTSSDNIDTRAKK